MFPSMPSTYDWCLVSLCPHGKINAVAMEIGNGICQTVTQTLIVKWLHIFTLLMWILKKIQ